MVGDLGNLVFHRLATVHDVGSPLLSQIVAKARVAERAQFKIGWEGDTCFVIPIPGTKNATAVNGSIIERKTELRQETASPSAAGVPASWALPSPSSISPDVHVPNKASAAREPGACRGVEASGLFRVARG